MELTKKEFKAMQHPLRLFSQRKFEYPIFKKMGCNVRNKVILEIGCGSGYGAELLMASAPLSYTGIDVMPEQINLALKRNLKNTCFFVHDAANLDFAADNSVDIVMDFGILHHIPKWEKVLHECYRVLKNNGEFYIEEPDITSIRIWDKLFHWEHPGTSIFSFKSLEYALRNIGFAMEKRKRIPLFNFYKAVK